MRNVLIFGTSYVRGQHARYEITLWRDLVTKLNPDADFLVIDSASPDLPPLPGVDVHNLGDNIGHLSRGGRDGWGRAFVAGLTAAYDWVVHIETDLLFAQPVAPIIKKLERYGVGAACPVALPYTFIETGLMFLRGDIAARLASSYVWSEPTKQLPEIRIGTILDDDLFCLPLRGCRNDGHMGVAQLRTAFPFGIDYLTHCREPAVYREFLRMNGL